MSVKKSIIITLALCVAVLSVASARTIKEATESPKSGLTVVLDAGHGGIDGGVTGVKTGVKESELNLKIVKELKTRLEKAGVKTVLTRTTDAGLYGNATDGFKRRDMLARKKIINGCNADAFVSVHINYYSSPSRRGAQAFFRENDELCETFAAVMQKNLNTLGGQPRPLSRLKAIITSLTNPNRRRRWSNADFYPTKKTRRCYYPKITAPNSPKKSPSASSSFYI